MNIICQKWIELVSAVVLLWEINSICLLKVVYHHMTLISCLRWFVAEHHFQRKDV